MKIVGFQVLLLGQVEKWHTPLLSVFKFKSAEQVAGFGDIVERVSKNAF